MLEYLNNLGIKIKLIFIFVVVKIIPLVIVAFLAIQGVQSVGDAFVEDSKSIVEKSQQIVVETANTAIQDSIQALDKKSQSTIERLTWEMAKNVANFLYARDQDLLFLSKIDLSQDLLEKFYQSRFEEVIVHEPYFYDPESHQWVSSNPIPLTPSSLQAKLPDNEREFRHNDPVFVETQNLPLYKEITFYDLKGQEQLKIPAQGAPLKNIADPKNTYIKAENYYQEALNLKEGEIYVSEVIGAYVGSKLIGPYTSARTEKAGIPFEPEKSAYAGKENPVGKRFEGILRLVTPVFKAGKKVGFLTLALDHRHLMEFTDTMNPTETGIYNNISDAAIGNYAFMWDYEGRNISHPRDYFIAGFDPETGEREPGWISKDLAERWEASGIEDLNEFLKTVPVFEEQSLEKKPNVAQIKQGSIALDCRYLNFAPQCQGWMQQTEDGGSGSFIIFWSNVWKLNTAATIPYYTGRYGQTKRGFGFITIGANVDEFHSAANETKANIDKVLTQQNNQIALTIESSRKNIVGNIQGRIQELGVYTVLMVFVVIAIALLLSNYITKRIGVLTEGATKFADQHLDYRIKDSSKDEIGQLATSFNAMAEELKTSYSKLEEYNKDLEKRVAERTKEVEEANQELKKTLEDLQQTHTQLVQSEKMAALGQLIAGISHEVNTPAAAISVAIQEIDKDYAPLIIELGDILVSLSPELRKHYYRICKVVLVHQEENDHSTVEQRKKAREIGKALAEHGIEVSRNWSKDFAMMGLAAKDMVELAPLLQSEESEKIQNALRTLGMTHVHLRDIRISIGRIKQLVDALRQHSRIDSISFSKTNLQEDLDNSLIILNNKMKNITVHKDYGEVPAVTGYIEQLNQVWTNLIHNAIQAMKGKGDLHLKVNTVNGNEVSIEVTDTGMGIPEDIQSKIFEPYFTTKPKGEGTGLGLSICKEIIDKHQGTINIASEPGNTCFQVIIPITLEASVS